MVDPLLHRSAGAPTHVRIGLEKYVSIKRTAERALGVDRIPLDPGRVIKTLCRFTLFIRRFIDPQVRLSMSR